MAEGSGTYGGPRIGTVGDTYIDALLAEYVPPDANFIEDLMGNETNQLLYALLVEQRARRIADGQDLQDVDTSTGIDESDRRGLYASLTVPTPADQWHEVDLDFQTVEVDLRFDADVMVAFADPHEETNVVEYDSGDSPVVGVPVKTSEIHLRMQGGSPGEVEVEAWSDNYR